MVQGRRKFCVVLLFLFLFFDGRERKRGQKKVGRERGKVGESFLVGSLKCSFSVNGEVQNRSGVNGEGERGRPKWVGVKKERGGGQVLTEEEEGGEAGTGCGGEEQSQKSKEEI